MVLVKRAMHTVSTNMSSEGLHHTATTTDDKLNCTLACIRAVQCGNTGKARRKALEYTHIATLINPEDPNAAYASGFLQLQDYATELAKQNILEELRDIQDSDLEPNDFRCTTRRNNALTALKRLRPGACNPLSAIQLPSGEFTTSSSEIAAALAQHWGRTFRRRDIDTELLRSWLDSLPSLRGDYTQEVDQLTPSTRPRDPGCSPPQASGPQARPRAKRPALPTDNHHWRIRRRDMEDAIKYSGNSCPGPDGVPFRAWRRLGALAITTLYEVAQTPQNPNFDAMLEEAYWDCHGDHLHHFNESKLT